MNRKDDIGESWWHSPKRVLAMIAGLMGLVGFSMAFIYVVAKIFGQDERRQQPVFIDATTPPPPAPSSRTRAPSALEWPDHPGRGAAVSFKGGRDQANDRSRGGGTAGAASTAASAAEKPVPVGLSSEEYRQTIDSGKKVYLPNPRGECDLSGQNAAKSIDALDSCFAQRAAR